LRRVGNRLFLSFIDQTKNSGPVQGNLASFAGDGAKKMSGFDAAIT
jgi:hypothetical protein